MSLCSPEYLRERAREPGAASIAICDALRDAADEIERLCTTLKDISEFCSNDASVLGATARLASIRNTADQAVRGHITRMQRT